MTQTFKEKRKEWLKRYIPAEIIGTTTALLSAWVAYSQTGSFVIGAAAGWIGEGIGFFGYFITLELVHTHAYYQGYGLWRRLTLTVAAASRNLIVEFLPAEIIDNFIIRPFAMYAVPIYVHPYPLGFLIGKFAADIIFYGIAIVGYEGRKRWFKR